MNPGDGGQVIYEYRAKQCPHRCVKEISCHGAEANRDYRKLSYDAGLHSCPHGHPYRRKFSARVVSRYKTVHAAGTSQEREFTSSREFARHLREESARVEERTGIPTRFEPVDLNDPSVLPPPDDGHEEMLRTAHDQAIASGDAVRSSYLLGSGE